MKRLLAQRQRHGWTWPELSRRCGLPVWKLHFWRRKLLGKKKAVRKPTTSFVSVEVVKLPQACPPAAPPLELVTPSGVRIMVAVGFDADHLQRVLRTLESGC